MQSKSTNKLQIALTPQDLDWVINIANKRFIENHMNRDLDGKQYVCLCYAEAFDAFLNKKGLAVNISLTDTRAKVK